MLAEGRAAAASIDAKRNARHSRQAADRQRGAAAYEAAWAARRAEADTSGRVPVAASAWWQFDAPPSTTVY
jgi:hypothetical protein